MNEVKLLNLLILDGLLDYKASEQLFDSFKALFNLCD